MQTSRAVPQNPKARFAEENNLDFIVDANKTLSYEELLEYANSGGEILREICDADIAEFSKKFFAAVAANCDVELSGFTISEAKISPAKQRVEKRRFGTVDDLLKAVTASASKISIRTSGTTGRPKTVSHTIETLTRNVKAGEKHAKDVWGFCYAPAHMAGLQVLLQAALNKNKCVNLFGKTRAQIYAEIEKNSVTHISATPTFYRLLLPAERTFGNVIRATFGGEKSYPSLYAAAAKIFPNAKITNIYASTEAGALLASCGDVFKVPEKIKGLVKIENGELFIHKSLLAASDGILLDGDFYATGDLVEFEDAQKTSFKFTGRKGDYINVGGYKVNPEKVEEALKSIDGVSDAIVYGKKNSVLGNILCAEIKLLPSPSLSEPDIRARLSRNLSQFEIPRIIKFVDSLQLTETGKIKRL